MADLPATGTLSANETGLQIALPGPTGKGRGSFSTLYVKGTWGGGTLKLQASPDDTQANALDVPGVSLTANGLISFQVNAESLWLVLSGASSPSLTWWLV